MVGRRDRRWRVRLEHRPPPFSREVPRHGEARCELEWHLDERVIRRFGRRDEALRERVEAFGSVVEAQGAFVRQLTRLLDKGYRPGIESDAHLADIERAFDDRDVRREYARWLAEHNDDRGRLIALQLSGADGPALMAWSPGLSRFGDYVGHLQWHLGFVDGVVADWSGVLAPDTTAIAAGLRRLLAHPSGIFVRRIDLQGLGVSCGPCPIATVLSDSGARRLTKISLGYLRRPRSWREGDIEVREVERRLREGLPALTRCAVEVSGSCEKPSRREWQTRQAPAPTPRRPRWWQFWRH